MALPHEARPRCGLAARRGVVVTRSDPPWLDARARAGAVPWESPPSPPVPWCPLDRALEPLRRLWHIAACNSVLLAYLLLVVAATSWVGWVLVGMRGGTSFAG